MAYEKTTWADGVTVIDAAKLNNIEAGIEANEEALTQKADKSELAQKADVSDLEDKADVSALAQKADKSELHNHSNKTVLDGVTSTKIDNWDEAHSHQHSHSNQAVLDDVTSTKVSNWDEAHSHQHSHNNKTDLDTLTESKLEGYDTAVTNVNAILSHTHLKKYASKKWVAYGDSITSQTYYNEYINGTDTYVTLLKNYLNIGAVKNYGIGSSCAGYIEDEPASSLTVNYNQHSSDTADADVITLAYGTNDWFNNVPLGVYGDSVNTTFWGAYGSVIKSIREANADCEIIILTPIWRDYASSTAGGELPYAENANGVTFWEYVDAIKEIARFYGVPCVDLHSNIAIRKYTASDGTGNYSGDGLHPNQRGQYKIARLLLPVLRDALDTVDFDMETDIVYTSANAPVEPEEPVEPDGPPALVTSMDNFLETGFTYTNTPSTSGNTVTASNGEVLVLAKTSAKNFWIQTTAASMLWFALYSNANTDPENENLEIVGASINNSISYGGVLMRGKFDGTCFLMGTNEYLYNRAELNLMPYFVAHKIHFMYDNDNDCWDISYISDGAETSVGSIAFSDINLGDISNGWATQTPEARFGIRLADGDSFTLLSESPV